MRTPALLATAALVMLPYAAGAQTPTTPPDATTTNAASGWIEFGARGTTFKGDDTARFERYRDLGNGLYLGGFRLNREKTGWLFDIGGQNVGRRDQRVTGSISKPGRFSAWGLWDQIPMLMSRTTRSLFVENFDDAPAVLTIPDAIQAQVQASAAALPGLFAANAATFETRSRRHLGQGGFEYLATPDLTVRARIQLANRKGTLPYGASFGHSSLVEFPAPIKHRMTDFDTHAEFVRGAVLFRGGFAGSWFHNDATQVTVDNPFRAVDVAGTPSRANLSQAPSNSLLSVNGMASVRLPRRSRATAYVSIGTLKDAGADLMPQTINSVNLAALLPLPRTKVNGEGRTSAMNLTFTSHPSRAVDLSVRYRLYDYDNRTPEFVLPQRVAYDNAPGVPTFRQIGGATSPLVVESEPFGVKRQSVDADIRVTPASASTGSAGIGFGRTMEDRSHRFFEATRENVFRLSYDVTGNPWFSVRTKYEHSQKRGDVTAEQLREAEIELFNIGEQPRMRHFDIASRDRDRVTLVGSVTPTGVLSINASVAAGKDDYLESTFGLRDNTHRVYTAGVDAVPTDRVTFGLSYSYERYIALLHSRQASAPAATAAISYDTFVQLSQSPANTLQVVDASRNWANEGADRVHSVVASFAVTNIAGKVDLRFNYDYNRARALYTYTVGQNIERTLPEDVPPPDTTLATPTQLPPIVSELRRGMLDLTYALTKRWGVGVSYWYDRYEVTDFTLDIDANPNLARGSALLLGYLYRPYTANTVWGRIIVRW